MHNCLETVATQCIVHGQVDIRIAWNFAANNFCMPAFTVAATTIKPSDGNRRLYSCSCHFFHRNSNRPACRSARQNYLRCRVFGLHKNATQTLYESTLRILQRWSVHNLEYILTTVAIELSWFLNDASWLSANKHDVPWRLAERWERGCKIVIKVHLQSNSALRQRRRSPPHMIWCSCDDIGHIVANAVFKLRNRKTDSNRSTWETI